MHHPLQNQCNLQDSGCIFLFPHQSNWIFFSPVASCTGIKPINPVTISFLLSLKNRTNLHKCFCVEMSVDSSKMTAYFLFGSYQWDQFPVQAKWCFRLSSNIYFYVTLCAPVYSHAHVLSWFHSSVQVYVSHNGRPCLEQFAVLLP
jgi:hypothetical protein